MADEQVDDKGRSWRSGAIVEKKPLKQWFLKTTNFSKELLDGLDDPSLEDWKDIITIQKNWIGQCNGTNIDFQIESLKDSTLSIWTDKPQFLKGVAFIGLSSGHILDRSDFHLLKELKGYNKHGIKILNIYAINPFTQTRIPIIVSDKFSENFLGIPEICKDHKVIADEAFIKYLPKALDEKEDFTQEELKGLD